MSVSVSLPSHSLTHLSLQPHPMMSTSYLSHDSVTIITYVTVVTCLRHSYYIRHKGHMLTSQLIISHNCRVLTSQLPHVYVLVITFLRHNYHMFTSQLPHAYVITSPLCLRVLAESDSAGVEHDGDRAPGSGCKLLQSNTDTCNVRLI